MQNGFIFNDGVWVSFLPLSTVSGILCVMLPGYQPFYSIPVVVVDYVGIRKGALLQVDKANQQPPNPLEGGERALFAITSSRPIRGQSSPSNYRGFGLTD